VNPFLFQLKVETTEAMEAPMVMEAITVAHMDMEAIRAVPMEVTTVEMVARVDGAMNGPMNGPMARREETMVEIMVANVMKVFQFLKVVTMVEMVETVAGLMDGLAAGMIMTAKERKRRAAKR
jgi:uncharacterized protein YcsI (UPF0317 family)